MTAEQLVNHLCYEYNNKNYDEEKLKAAQELKKKLKAFEILKRCNIDIDYEDGEDGKFIVGTRHYTGITKEDKKLIEEVM